MISEIEIKNFLSVENINLTNLEKKDIIAVFGRYEGLKGYSNGSGKSSLVESIDFAFTGKHRYSKTTDIKLIRKGAKEASVKIVFLDGKNRVQIERILKKKKDNKSTSSTAIVKIDDSIKANSTNEANNFLNSYFNITPKNFKYSYFFRQKHYDTILRDKPTQRIQFFEEFFEANIFNSGKKVLSKKKKIINQDINTTEARISNHEENLEKIDVVKIKSDLKMLEEKINKHYSDMETLDNNDTYWSDMVRNEEIKIAKEEEKIKELPKLIQDVESITKKGLSLKKQREDLLEKIKEIENDVKLLKNNLENLPSIDFSLTDSNNISNYSDRIEKMNIDINVSNMRKNIIKERISKLNVNECVICTSPISDNLRNRLVSESKREIVNIDESISSIENKRDKLLVDLDILDDKKREHDSREKKIDNIKNKIEHHEVSLKGKYDMMQAIDDQLSELRKEVSIKRKKRDKLKEIKINDTDLIMYKNNLESIRKNKRETLNKVLSLESDKKEKESLISDIKSTKSKISKLKKELKGQRQYLSDFNSLDNIFNKCRGEMLSVGLDELEEHTNDIIGEIGAVQKSISFDTKVETQKGDLNDTLNIYLTDVKGKRIIDGLSGGEWDLSAVAIRSALSRYKLHRLSSKIDFIVLDEIFGSLDEASQVELISAIRMFKDYFSQIFVITHTDLKNMFENNITVCMGKDGITRLEND